MELLNPNTPEGRELGYLAIRLATLNAEKSSNRAALRRSLEHRIDAIVRKANGQAEQPIELRPSRWNKHELEVKY